MNRSGFLMETSIDITPGDPIPTPSVGPLDPECVEEGLIVCDRQKMKGKQGVSLDTLMAIFTHLGREVEGIGVAHSHSLAQRVLSVIEEAKPLLTKVALSLLGFHHVSLKLVIDSFVEHDNGLPLRT